MDDDKIEAVASSFYAIEYNSHSWDCAPEALKNEFRLYARSAIELCARQFGPDDGLHPIRTEPLPRSRRLLH